jgi:hypothetical protein
MARFKYEERGLPSGRTPVGLLILLIVVVIIVLQFISITLSPLGWKDTATPLILIITFVRDGAPTVPIGVRYGLSIKVAIKC